MDAPRRGLAGDESAVSEVVGYLLVFGILSVLMVMSMVAFGIAQELAEERAIALEAESAAARVAGVVVQTALVAEQEGSSVSVNFAIDLPDQFEGEDYVIRLESEGSTTRCDTDDDTLAETGETANADQVCILVEALDLGTEAPLFAAAAPTNVAICTTQAAGGGIAVTYTTAPSCGAGKFISVGVGS